LGWGWRGSSGAQRTRKHRVAQLDLLDDDRAHVVLGLHAPDLGVDALTALLADLRCKFLSWHQVNRQVSFKPLLSSARRWSAFWSCCKSLSRRRASSLWTLDLLLELRAPWMFCSI